MIKNISSLKLLGILAVLVGIYLVIEFFGGRTRSKSFRSELVEIDTSKVSQILIDSKGEVLELKKEGAQWKVGISDGKYANAQKSSVKNTLNSLSGIKPSRLAAKDPAKWKEFQVDSAGTRVRVFEGDRNALDLVIGRFGVQGQRSFYTFVRLFEENEVYAADNFMGISFGTESSDYRNKQVLSLTTDSISEIRFQYPSDSAFTMLKADSLWIVNGQVTDSAATASYMSDIRYVNNSNFVDDVNPGSLVSPTMSMVIAQNGEADVTVKAFQHPIHKWIVNSSTNPESYFADTALFEELFISKAKIYGSDGG
jgi:hypothetical protein